MNYVGRLVKIMRASIGVPSGTLGLVLRRHESHLWENESYFIYEVQLLNGRTFKRRFLDRDLVVVS
jgi:hypothetical protein